MELVVVVIGLAAVGRRRVVVERRLEREREREQELEEEEMGLVVVVVVVIGRVVVGRILVVVGSEPVVEERRQVVVGTEPVEVVRIRLVVVGTLLVVVETEPVGVVKIRVVGERKLAGVETEPVVVAVAIGLAALGVELVVALLARQLLVVELFSPVQVLVRVRKPVLVTQVLGVLLKA